MTLRGDLARQFQIKNLHVHQGGIGFFMDIHDPQAYALSDADQKKLADQYATFAAPGFALSPLTTNKTPFHVLNSHSPTATKHTKNDTTTY